MEYTLEKKKLVESVIQHSHILKTVEQLEATGKRALGVSYRIDAGIWLFTTAGRWEHVFNVNDSEDKLAAAADVLQELASTVVAEQTRQQAIIREKIKGALLVADVESLKDLHAEDDTYVVIGHERGDVLRLAGEEWMLVQKGADLEQEQAMTSAEMEVNERARDVLSSTAALIAPAMDDWPTIMEPVNTEYPSMYTPEGERLSTEVVQQLHAQYLDTQRRVMLTKSAMVAFGGNSKDGTEFTVRWLEQQLLQVMQVPVVETEQDGQKVFLATVQIPGMKAELADSHYRTLLVRVAHFVATRHDPDTDEYVNSRLREFQQRIDVNQPPKA